MITIVFRISKIGFGNFGNSILLIFCISLSQIALSQNSFQSGYILKNNGDTVKGFIDKNEHGNQACLFRLTQDSEVIVYKPFEIVGYRFDVGNFYVSKSIELQNSYKAIVKLDHPDPWKPGVLSEKSNLIKGTYIDSFFLEFLVKGQINLYYKKLADNDLYFMEDSSGRIIDITPKTVEVYKHGVQRGYVPDKSGKGKLKYLMRDAPKIQSRIDNITFDHKSLINITTNYHNEICNNNDCVVYYRTIKPVKLRYNVDFGISDGELDLIIMSNFGNHKKVNFSSNGNDFLITGGVLVHDLIPSREKFYIGLNIHYRNSTYEHNYTGKSDLGRDTSYFLNLNCQNIGLTTKGYSDLRKGIFKPFVSYGLYGEYLLGSEFKANMTGTKVQLQSDLPSFSLGLWLGAGISYAPGGWGDMVLECFYQGNIAKNIFGAKMGIRF